MPLSKSLFDFEKKQPDPEIQRDKQPLLFASSRLIIVGWVIQNFVLTCTRHTSEVLWYCAIVSRCKTDMHTLSYVHVHAHTRKFRDAWRGVFSILNSSSHHLSGYFSIIFSVFWADVTLDFQLGFAGRANDIRSHTMRRCYLSWMASLYRSQIPSRL